MIMQLSPLHTLQVILGGAESGVLVEDLTRGHFRCIYQHWPDLIPGPASPGA